MKRQSNSYMDPHGFLLDGEGDVVRLIQPASRDFYQRLLTSPFLSALVARGEMVACAPRDAIAEFEDHLAIAHPRLAPVTYATEWSPSALKDAAILTLEMARDLVACDLTLQDATPWNILFPAATPVFVDLTSIVPTHPTIIWKAQSQFETLFHRPLLLCAEGKGEAARALLTNPVSGVNVDSFNRLISSGYHLRHPQHLAMNVLSRRIQANESMRRKLLESARAGTGTVPRALRQNFFQRLIAKIRKLSFPISADGWERYYREIPAEVEKEAKVRIVTDALAQLKPSRVVDLGANTGVFSMIAARAGANVVAVDSSESCAESIYAAAKKENFGISVVLCDIAAPRQPTGMLPDDFPALWSRIAGDTVLCLGLMHHLHVLGRQPLDRIAALLALLGRTSAIVEYVAPDDANVARLDILEKPQYSADDLIRALSVYYQDIQMMASDRPTRALLICREPWRH